MATGGTRISSTGKLVTVANAISDIINKYNTEVNNLYSIGSEIDGMWDGPASEKFTRQMQEDRNVFNGLANLLSKYVSALNEDAAHYEKADNDALNTVTTNRVR